MVILRKYTSGKTEESNVVSASNSYFAYIFYLKRFTGNLKIQVKLENDIQEALVCPAVIQVLDLMTAIQTCTMYNWGFHFFSILHHLPTHLF